MRRVVVLLVLAVMVLTGCSSTTTGVEKKADDRLPDAVLAAFAGGDPLDVGRLRGPAVINLWSGTCTPCRREMPFYESFARQARGKVAMIGIDYAENGGSEAESLVRDTGVTYPLYKDPSRKLPSRALPQLLLVDAKGRVVHREYVAITSVGQLDRLVAKHLRVTTS